MTLGRENLEEVLRENATATSSSTRQQKLRAVLVSVEIALAMVLLTGAGLMMRSFWKMNSSGQRLNPNKFVAAPRRKLLTARTQDRTEDVFGTDIYRG